MLWLPGFSTFSDPDDDATCGELAPLVSAARDRPCVNRLVAIIRVSRDAAARGATVPPETRALTRRAVWQLGPRGWWSLWCALRSGAIRTRPLASHGRAAVQRAL